MCDEDLAEMTAEEFELDADETKKRGPFVVRRETKRWKDFMGKDRSREYFVVNDAAGVKVAGTESELAATRWALDLTSNGFIEE